MTRWLTGAILALVAVAPALAADEVIYHDRTNHNPRAKVTGVIQEESLKGISIKVGREIQRIPASDIAEVDYQNLGDLTRIEFHRPFNREDEAMKPTTSLEDRRRLLAQAASLYRGVAQRLPETSYPSRYVQFRLAQLMARQAELDASLEGAAAAALTGFMDRHAESWELIPCARLLARIQEGRGDLVSAQKTYEELLSQSALPAEARRDCDLAVVRLMLRRKQHTQAEKKLLALQKQLAADDPLLPQLRVNLAECRIADGRLAEAEPDLKAILKGNAEGGTKALACNALAEGYERANRLEEAFWQFLWVDVIYHQDPEEHARALYHLSKLFRQVKSDPVRAEQCREKLLKDPAFAGKQYQLLAASEK